MGEVLSIATLILLAIALILFIVFAVEDDQ